MQANKIFRIKIAAFLFVLLCDIVVFAQNQKSQFLDVPFSTDSTHLTVHNGEKYVPIFIKGVNLGVSKPGTFPGQLSATREDYDRWLKDIRDAGFNTIRLYTLHFPRFYEALADFNAANPNTPLYFFQGVWLEEEVPDYHNDLLELTDIFEQEMTENVSAVHGQAIIAQRVGKAYGSFTADVSKYLLGYITAREIHPNEVWTTNELHPDVTTFSGNHFSIENKKAAEAWMCARLNFLVDYELTNFDTQRPVSFSSWPSLDPLFHKDEVNRYEDSVSIDLSTMNRVFAPAGFFASYHAYPYYPDFMSRDSAYLSYYDYEGQNSYLGYLNALKNHYKGIPLIIAEFGSSTSWGVAHYANNGINHGGSSEVEQGKNFIRMFKNIESSGCAGGVQFAWIDEWFKRTWISDPVDYVPDRRVLWHNITSAEQNFGVIGFQMENDELNYFEGFCSACPLQDVLMGANYDFLRMKIQTNGYLSDTDTMIIALDTYSDSLGESYLPNGDSLPHRCEFYLLITNESASLMVTQAYDLYGNWHGTSGPEQIYKSTRTDHEPWRLVRWKNNNTTQEVQYIGNLGVNRLQIPLESTDAVRLNETSVEIRLPWSLLNFTDPSNKTVVHDDRSTPTKEDTISAGVHFSVHYKGLVAASTNRYAWNDWNIVTDYIEYKKASYDILKNELHEFNMSSVARSDRYTTEVGEELDIPVENGLLMNDLSLDGHPMQAYVKEMPKNGWLSMNQDGSFAYQPYPDFKGEDYFTYETQTSSSVSNTATVRIEVTGDLKGAGFVTLYPNPNEGKFAVRSTSIIDEVIITDMYGQELQVQAGSGKEIDLDLNTLSSGVYFVTVLSGSERISRKMVKN